MDAHSELLYSGVPREQWLIIHGLALSVISLSLSGSCYIVHETLRQWTKASLRTTQKFPMWISMTDLLFSVFHGVDHALSISRGYVSTGVFCQFLGFGTVFAMNLPAFWVSAVAFYLWSLVVRNHEIDTGRQDWKLHVACWGLPLVWGLVPFVTNDYGPEPMWCGVPDRLFIFNGVVVLGGMLTSAFFYGYLVMFLIKHRHVLHHSGRTKYRNDSCGSPGVPGDGLPAGWPQGRFGRLIRHLPIFVAIYLFQWTPYLVYALLLLAGKGARRRDTRAEAGSNSSSTVTGAHITGHVTAAHLLQIFSC